jgi:hypothetical protein
LWLPDEVIRKLTEVEVIKYKPGVGTRHIETSGMLVARDQVDETDVVHEGQQLTSRAGIAPPADLDANFPKM